jgi:Zn-dependent M28 family amino/carboxypeptidase
MDHEVLKVYSGITNVVLRISAKGKRKWEGGEVVKDAVLLGAHIDSTLPAPGASE